MTMATIVRRRGWLAIVGVFAVGVLLSGCPSATNKEKADRQPTKTDAGPVAADQHRGAAVPATRGGQDVRAANSKKGTKKEPPEEKVAQEVEQMAEKPAALGPPLVDNPGELKRLHPEQAVWVDADGKQVVLQGTVCFSKGAAVPLEFFATYGNRSYEAVVAVSVTPHIVHAGLLAVGAEPGHPARFQPEYVPSTGTEVAIQVRWKDASGKVQSCPAQNWIRDIKTKEAMDPDLNWVFAGSISEIDKAGNMISYQADSGEMICVLSLPAAMLDLPVRGYGRGIEARSYEAFAEHLPPEGTPVTLLLKPILSGKPTAPAGKEAAPTRHAAAERKAVAAAEAWLAACG